MAEEAPLAVAGRQNAVRPPIVFITNPWQCPIDLSTKAGSHLWSKGTKPMEDKFNGTGQDVARFVAIVNNHVPKCCLDVIVRFGRKNLLVDYGTISLEEVQAAGDIRLSTEPTTLEEDQPILKAKILCHYIYNSLGKGPLRKVMTRVNEILEAGLILPKSGNLTNESRNKAHQARSLLTIPTRRTRRTRLGNMTIRNSKRWYSRGIVSVCGFIKMNLASVNQQWTTPKTKRRTLLSLPASPGLI